MARCLVIGGDGFLGSHVVDLLAAVGHDVTVFDKFATPDTTYTSTAPKRIAGDFLKAADLRKALRGAEYLFHFVSTTTPASAEDNPGFDVTTNVAQSVVLLEEAVAAGVSRVYFASTGGAMYGNAATERVSEASVASPISPYAIGKLAIEGYLRYFGHKHGLQSVTFRISNPYGPRQHPNRRQGVIPTFLDCIARGLPLTVYGDGSAVRDYIYAEDAARMVVETVGLETEHAIYNVGSGEGTSLNRLIDLARLTTGLPVAVEFQPQPSSYVDRVVLDPSRYFGEFQARPRVSLADGIAQTWQAMTSVR